LIGTDVSDEPAASILRAKPGDSRILRNVGAYLPNYTASDPKIFTATAMKSLNLMKCKRASKVHTRKEGK
jgi:hypothetical protein